MIVQDVRTVVDGKLRYEALTGEFYLDDPEITELQLYGFAEKYSIVVKNVMRIVLKEYFAKKPVYRLKQDDFKQSLAKSLLKSVTVVNGILVAEIDFFNSRQLLP